MIPFAHVAGIPLEELLPMVTGPGTGLLAVRAWMAMSLRRNGGDER